MRKSQSIRAARKAAEKRKYDAFMLDTFDKLEHTDRRDQRDQAAEVRRKARGRL